MNNANQQNNNNLRGDHDGDDALDLEAVEDPAEDPAEDPEDAAAEDPEDAADPPVYPARRQMLLERLTIAMASRYPRMQRYSDKLGYLLADACRKAFVGIQGTNIEMMDFIKASDVPIVVAQISLFLVKNQIKPAVSDLAMLEALAMETGRRLAKGDAHTVNRRAQLTSEGVLAPFGGDVVPLAVRGEWVD